VNGPSIQVHTNASKTALWAASRGGCRADEAAVLAGQLASHGDVALASSAAVTIRDYYYIRKPFCYFIHCPKVQDEKKNDGGGGSSI